MLKKLFFLFLAFINQSLFCAAGSDSVQIMLTRQEELLLEIFQNNPDGVTQKLFIGADLIGATEYLIKKAMPLEISLDNQQKILTTFLARGLDVNAITQACITLNQEPDTRKYETALIMSAQHNPQLIPFLLDQKADANIFPPKEKSPLFILAEHTNNADLIRLLVNNGKAKINQVNMSKNVSALHAASYILCPKNVSALIECNADVSLQDDKRNSPICWAVHGLLKQQALENGNLKARTKTDFLSIMTLLHQAGAPDLNAGVSLLQKARGMRSIIGAIKTIVPEQPTQEVSDKRCIIT